MGHGEEPRRSDDPMTAATFSRLRLRSISPAFTPRLGAACLVGLRRSFASIGATNPAKDSQRRARAYFLTLTGACSRKVSSDSAGNRTSFLPVA